MKNVEMSLEGNILTIKVDLSRKRGLPIFYIGGRSSEWRGCHLLLKNIGLASLMKFE